jgi:hypothetical protein
MMIARAFLFSRRYPLRSRNQRSLIKRHDHHRQQQCFSQQAPQESSSPPKLSRRSKLDLLLVVSGAVGTWLYAKNSDWDQDVWDAKQRLLSSAVKIDPLYREAISGAKEADDLPLPVKKYLEEALNDPDAFPSNPKRWQPQLTSVHQSGEFFASHQWYAFTSRLLTLTHAPGFVWESHVEILKIPNRVLETFIDQKGSIITKAWGKFPMIQVEEEEPYILFWLAMAPLTPTAFLENSNAQDNAPIITWNPIHDLSSCSAQLYDNGEKVNFQLEFEFYQDTQLLKSIKVTSPCLPQPWQAIYKDYRQVNKLCVPTTIEVGKWFEGELKLHLKLTNRQLEFKQLEESTDAKAQFEEEKRRWKFTKK